VRRRALLVGIGALALTGLTRVEALPMRTAVFEEVGDSVLMTVELPELLRKGDREALASIDSGFETSLVYEIKLLEHGTLGELTTLRQVVGIHYDLWHKRYVVESRDPSGGAAKRYFGRRAAAISHAVTLRRLRIARASALERGPDGPYYIATIHAMRNPMRSSSMTRPTPAGGRGHGRSPGWFRRLVEFLGGSQPVAEEVVHVRTNPFFLQPR
jgi:hypothetical protein